MHQHHPTTPEPDQPLSRETPDPPGYEPPLDASPLLDHLVDDGEDVAGQTR